MNTCAIINQRMSKNPNRIQKAEGNNSFHAKTSTSVSGFSCPPYEGNT